MSKTKGWLVEQALRKAGVASSSSLIEPTSAMTSDYLIDLESMIAEWDGVWGVRIGYMFGDPENGTTPSDESGIPDWAETCVIMNLAVRILTDRNRPMKPSVAASAHSMFVVMKARLRKPKQLSRPSTMPRGAGWKTQHNNRFYHEKEPTLETSDGQIIIE